MGRNWDQRRLDREKDHICGSFYSGKEFQQGQEPSVSSTIRPMAKLDVALCPEMKMLEMQEEVVSDETGTSVPSSEA